MMKSTYKNLCLLVIALFSACACTAQTTTPLGEGPRFSFKETVHDFGKITRDTAVDYQFEFVNSGSSLLIINDVALSCPCFSVNWKRGAVMPGEKGWVSVHYPINHDGPFDKVFWLTSNAVNINPNLARFELRIKGLVALKQANHHRKKRHLTTH